MKEEPGDYVLRMNILVSGVHSYNGIIKKNIVGVSLLELAETDAQGNTAHIQGMLKRCHYDRWVLSSYFISAFLALLVLELLIVMKKIVKTR